ncbi:MAG: PEP-CTERM sorting domain-containing protein [Planctomycetota bacterium]
MKLNSKILTALILVATTHSLVAQTDIDPSLWSGDTTNPTGELAIPAVEYDPNSGIMCLNSAGLNGVIDTTTGDTIGGDDVGMISIAIEGPEADEVYFDGFVESAYGGGILWRNLHFAGRQQMFGIGTGPQYLDPSLQVNLFRYSPGLAPGDFGRVEMAINYAAGSPGGILFGGVQFASGCNFVPEPESFTLIFALTLLALFGFRRRRSG